MDCNLVPTKKMSGDIRLCTDLWKLNKASKKYNYPIPPMEKKLQCVCGTKIISLLYGFSYYNQVLVAHDD